METGIAVGWGAGLLILCVVAWIGNLVSLPGNWLAVTCIAVYAWIGPEEGRVAIGWTVAAAAFGLALVGEIAEFIAGAYGAQRAGASRRSTLLAMLGSLIGAIAGAIIGVPVPVVGSLLAALLFGSAGALAGAMYGEWSDGKSWRESWTVGHAAFWGRLVGTLGKLGSGAAILIMVMVALLL
jgi:uncharacterized protein YqgC (DUF456 family)